MNHLVNGLQKRHGTKGNLAAPLPSPQRYKLTARCPLPTAHGSSGVARTDEAAGVFAGQPQKGANIGTLVQEPYAPGTVYRAEAGTASIILRAVARQKPADAAGRFVNRVIRRVAALSGRRQTVSEYSLVSGPDLREMVNKTVITEWHCRRNPCIFRRIRF
jgi:hypothetical protein